MAGAGAEPWRERPGRDRPVSVPALLAELRSRDIEVWADGDQLRCSAPAGVLDPALREELRQRKDDIVKFFGMAQALARQQPAIVPLQPAGTQPPIFAVPGHSGDVFCFRALARHLGDDQPFFGLQPPGVDGQRPPLDSVAALAADFAAQIVAFRPGDPYVIVGYCAGGTVAFELARQLVQQGATVRCVALFGSPYPAWYRLLPQLRVKWMEQVERVQKHWRALTTLSLGELRAYFAAKQGQRRARQAEASRIAADPVMVRRAAVESATFKAIRRYTPQHFAGRLAMFLPNDAWPAGNGLLRWPGWLAQHTEVYCGPESCNGYNMLLEPHAAAFAALFRTAISCEN
jgi:thioesterase domain-containing protein